jgi:serine/threonine-protein kinase RsbT
MAGKDEPISSRGQPAGARLEVDPSGDPALTHLESVVHVESGKDILRARAIGHELCRRLGLSEIAETKVVSAVFELGRNICRYARTGRITLRRAEGSRGIEIVAQDEGPGIANVDAVLNRACPSRTSIHLGLHGTRRLMDYFNLVSEPGRGTTVTIRKLASSPL